MWNIQLSELFYDNREKDAVIEVLESGWLSMGERSAAFEKCFSAFIGLEDQSVFVSSATAGLHLALMALNIGEGDEVIIPGLTFVSDANVVMQMGATPILADSVSISDLNVCVHSIISKITKKTKAIIVVHFAGFPMDLEQLMAICEEKNIILIEDCAHAPGASINGVHCGAMGHIGFFSFFANKNLAIGEGGMVVSRDPVILEKVRNLRSHGMSAVTLDRHKGRASSYDVTDIGLNYRADEIRAAIGIVQLEKVTEGNLKRKEIFSEYLRLTSGSPVKMSFSDLPPKNIASYHIACSILPPEVDRNSVMQKLKEKGIQTSIHYPNFKNFSAYKKFFRDTDLKNVDQICSRELTLPLHPNITLEQAREVISKLLEAF